MTSGTRPPCILAHLVAAPLVRKASAIAEGSEPSPVKQQNYARERYAIKRTLVTAQRAIEFRSDFATEHSFLMNLTGCRVLHFTWNGDADQDQALFEDKQGCASLVTEDWFKGVCKTKETLPEVMVLTAASVKLVAQAFVRAGISIVIAVETRDDRVDTLGFMHDFYTNLVEGSTVQESFVAGVQSLPKCDRGRCFLFPKNGERCVRPFDDAQRTGFNDSTLRLPRMLRREEGACFRGREAEVQETYKYLHRRIKVITIRGKPGIGKTEVAFQACAYAWERRLFCDMFFVPLKDQRTGEPITALKDVAARIADAFGISKQQIREHPEGFLGCIQHKCGSSPVELLLVLDGCPPHFVNEKNERITLSSVMEKLCQRVSKLQYIVTVVPQVGITKEKVVNINKLDGIAAAELFDVSAPREVSVEELRGGMVVTEPQLKDAECIRLFAGSAIMTALGGHPGAIVAASRMLRDRHLVRHEDAFLEEIERQVQRYEMLETEIDRQTNDCANMHSDPESVIEREWGGRQARGERTVRQSRDNAREREPLRHAPRASRSNGEFWWNRAVERHTGRTGAVSQTVPWEVLSTESLAEYFVEVLGKEGRERPLADDEFQALANSKELWDPHSPPAVAPGVIASQQGFLGSFWPWFKAATMLLKRTGYWSFQKYPVICGLTTTRFDGQRLLQGRPVGTFLLRLSSKAGALALMYVKEPQQVKSVLILAPADEDIFEMDYGTRKRQGSLEGLILSISKWTHLFPDTAKSTALDKST